MRTTAGSADTMGEAGGTLLSRALDPKSWTVVGLRKPLEDVCLVGGVQVCASVDVLPTLDTYIRVSFKGPDLSPMKAAEYLEEFTACRFPFVRNAEWLCEVDSKSWIHFTRPYTPATLEA